MRLLLVSDLHYTLPQLDWVVTSASQFDLVVMAGDHLDISSAVAPAAQIAVIQEYVTRLRQITRVVVSSGNHDLTGPDTNGEQAALWLGASAGPNVVIDGGSLDAGNTLVSVFPWWDGPIGREAVCAQLDADAARRPERWIWVYHWPPLGSPTTWTGKRSYGDGDLAAWIEQHRPDVVLTGHVHQPPFKADGAWADRIGETWVFNPGRQIGAEPTYIDIDFDYGEAMWSSYLGREFLKLTDAAAPARSVV
ncbi:MAG: metallophosphoesterase [Acidimicrobiia bacterium]